MPARDRSRRQTRCVTQVQFSETDEAAGRAPPCFYALLAVWRSTGIFAGIRGPRRVFGQLYRWPRRSVNFHLKSSGYYDYFGRRRHPAQAIFQPATDPRAKLTQGHKIGWARAASRTTGAVLRLPARRTAEIAPGKRAFAGGIRQAKMGGSCRPVVINEGSRSCGRISCR